MDKFDLDVLKSRLKDLEHALRYLANHLDDETLDFDELTIGEIRNRLSIHKECETGLRHQLHQLEITQEMLK